jgi:hypothetical protein
MKLGEKLVHSFLLGVFFSIINWFLINQFIIEISIFKYILVELIFVISVKLYKFTRLKFNLN